MKVYEVGKRDERLFGVSMCLIGGLVFLLFATLWLLGVLTLNGKERPTTFEDYFLVGTGVLFGCFFCYKGWCDLNDCPYEICIYDNGIVEFRRIWGSVTMNATEIYTVKKVQEADEGGLIARELRIQHPHGRITIINPVGIDELMAHLLSLNPAIVVQGSWTY